MRTVELQNALNRLGADPKLDEDGYMGPATRRAILWFEALAGLEGTGVPSAALEQKINELLQQSAGVPRPASVRGVCIRGLGNQAFSEGMDSLAARLNRIEHVRFTVHNMGVFYYENLMAIYALLESAGRAGARVVAIGHSMGGDEVWKISGMLDSRGIAVPLAVSADPTGWGSPGGWVVTKNVAVCGNFWQPRSPGGGRLKNGVGRTASLNEHELNVAHVQIDNDSRFQDWVVQQVKTVAAPAPMV
jgi:hypothetical protein